MQPQLRNIEHLNSLDAVRELMRRQFPQPGAVNGLVVSDIDMVMRFYGPTFNTDSKGKFIFTEWKQGGGSLTNGQAHTYKGIHEVMRAGDPYMKRYMGFYKINYTNSGTTEADRFNLECVTFDKATQLYDKPTKVISGHQAIFEFLTTLNGSVGDAI